MTLHSKYVTGPQIARLFGRERTWAWRRLTAGDFGPPIYLDGQPVAPLEAVEQFAGRTISLEQLEAARKPHRVRT